MAELRKGFHHELDEVKQEVLRLAASTIESIARATNVILSGDLEGADYLIQFDDEIDARSVDLEDRCYQILALQAPVAGDLRQVVALVIFGPNREHLQSSTTYLWSRTRSETARDHRQDGRSSAATIRRSH